MENKRLPVYLVAAKHFRWMLEQGQYLDRFNKDIPELVELLRREILNEDESSIFQKEIQQECKKLEQLFERFVAEKS